MRASTSVRVPGCSRCYAAGRKQTSKCRASDRHTPPPLTLLLPLGAPVDHGPRGSAAESRNAQRSSITRRPGLGLGTGCMQRASRAAWESPSAALA